MLKENSTSETLKMSEDQKMSMSAYSDFTSGKYSSSLNVINQIYLHRPNDSKVLHNRAVVEFYSSGEKNIEGFQRSLSSVCNMNRITIKDSEDPEDVEHSVIYYNQAIIYYYQRQYDKALKIMGKVFGMVQAMEESLAHKVCLFLLELNICVEQIDDALALISYMENQFCSKDTLKLDKSSSFDAATEEFRQKLTLFKVRCHLMSKNFDPTEKNLDAIHNYGKQDFSTTLFRAKLEMSKRNYQKAYDILIKVQEDIDGFENLSDERKFIFYNNMGIIFHYLGKPATAKFYIAQKAFRVYLNALEAYPDPNDLPPVFRPEKIASFKYNLGVVLLFGGKPVDAFEYLTAAIQLMIRSPVAWLRLGECCIQAHSGNNKRVFDFQERRQELVSGAVGAGVNRKLILNNDLYKNTAYSIDPQSYAIPGANLGFATLCFKNAKSLLPKFTKNEVEDIRKLRIGIMAKNAYVNLMVGNYVETVPDCVRITEDEKSSDFYKFLAQTYKSEAFLLYDKLSDAFEALHPTLFKNCDPALENHLCKWYPRNRATAFTVAQYNQAVVLVNMGEWEKAADILKRIWVARGPDIDVPIHVICLALYIELILGHMDIVRTIIRQNCPSAISQSP